MGVRVDPHTNLPKKGESMRNRIFRVEVSKTIQEHQFEPVKANVSLEAELEDDEDFDEVVSEARDLCREQVHRELAEWLS